MIITAPSGFLHAGNLPALFDSRDPRQEGFTESNVVVDLRGCEFISPPAVLWCLVYPLLARLKGSDCSPWVPINMGVCIYLKSLGLFSILQDNGIKVDDRGIGYSQAAQLILPLTKCGSEPEVEQLTNEAYEALQESGLGAANLYPIVSETFAELATNAVQHSESTIESYGFIQFYDSDRGRRFVCGVADGGIGIRKSLEKNPSLRDRIPYDWAAIELALRERVSGTRDASRGIGLFGVAEDMRKAGRQLIIHSGIGSANISEELESRALRTRLFPGTLAYASIPT